MLGKSDMDDIQLLCGIYPTFVWYLPLPQQSCEGFVLCVH